MTESVLKQQTALPPLVSSLFKALDDKKAEHIKILYVGDVSSITDFFIIATGTSTPHLRALSEAVNDVLEAGGERCTVSGVGTQTGWVVVDCFDTIIHLFTAETRRHFNLEGLWKDGQLCEVADALAVS
jgi:ribosome-associated protein